MACGPDREHDILGLKDVALGGLDREVASRARHLDDIGVIGDAHLVVRRILIPVTEDIFARNLGKAAVGAQVERSEERRVGKECVSTCRHRWSLYHYTKNKT